MDAVVATGNIGVGMGVAATQLGLIVGAAATNLVLDCIIATKNAGKGALNKGISFQKAIEQRIYNAIGLTQELAKVDFNFKNGTNQLPIESDRENHRTCKHISRHC